MTGRETPRALAGAAGVAGSGVMAGAAGVAGSGVVAGAAGSPTVTSEGVWEIVHVLYQSR